MMVVVHPASSERRGLLAIGTVVVLLNAVGWGVLIAVVAPQDFQLGADGFGIGIGLTAFLLGARHAFDADHIAIIDNATRKRLGNKKWNKRVREVIAQLEPIFNYRRLYIGGGNARHVQTEGLPANVVIVDNLAGLLGGIKLWN